MRAVRFERPETLREVRIPVLVMLGCAAVARDPVIEEPAMVFAPVIVPYIDPLTKSDERVPTDVILGCAGLTRDPVSAVRLESPDTLRDVRIP